MAFFYLKIFLASFFIVFALTPRLIRLALRSGVVDRPDARRVNVTAIPRLGGPAFFAALAVALLIWGREGKDVWAVLAGSTAVFLIGVVDDVKGLSSRVKLMGQIVAATLVFVMGVKIEFLTNPMGGMWFLPPWASFAVTLLWIVGITNALNLLDGLDGLAAGVTSIAALALFLIAADRGQTDSAVLAIALMGASAGFLRWNFYPAKIFMGDSGALLLGFVFSLIAVNGAFKSTAMITFIVPVIVLGVPIFDTGFAIVRRVAKGRPVMSSPDREHLHHQLMDRGMKHRNTVIVIHLMTLSLSALALCLADAWRLALYLLGGMIGLTGFLLLMGKFKLRHGEKEKDSQRHRDPAGSDQNGPGPDGAAISA